jgi:hypothetical protein
MLDLFLIIGNSLAISSTNIHKHTQTYQPSSLANRCPATKTPTIVTNLCTTERSHIIYTTSIQRYDDTAAATAAADDDDDDVMFEK